MAEGMAPLFDACVAELERALRPLTCVELTKRARASLARETSFREDVEDVREKLLVARSRGTFYAPQPHCLGALRRWFHREDQPMFAADPFRILIPRPPITTSVGAGLECLMRVPHMIQKTSAPTERRMEGLARGMQIEHWVRHYFESSWPEAVIPPDNHGAWTQWCDHDFKLRLGGDVFRVDVWGPDRSGSFRLAAGKRATDIHLPCEIADGELWWIGVALGRDANGEFSRGVSMLSPERLAVRLTCERAGLPWQELRARACGRDWLHSSA